MSYATIQADCIEAMADMDEASMDAVVCDPPYGLEFMGKEWDRLGGLTEEVTDTENRDGNWTSKPFGGGGQRVRYGSSAAPMQAWHEAWAREALRVLKPGAHLLAFGGTRTFHRLTCALEDAGFEIRDCLMWLYGQGFPKSLDVSKAIDKLDAAAERDGRAKRSQAWLREHVTAQQVDAVTRSNMGYHLTTHPTQPFVPTPAMFDALRPLLPPVPEWLESLIRERAVESENMKRREVTGERAGTTSPGFAVINNGRPTTWQETLAHTPDAERWQGWGTALKPSWEPIVLARKPLSGTVAATVLEHGTGALNVDGCRIGTDVTTTLRNGDSGGTVFGRDERVGSWENPSGRWPANTVLSHSEDCVRVGARRVRAAMGTSKGDPDGHGIYGAKFPRGDGREVGYADADGMETTELWACVPGCPVRMLDEQSGQLGKSQGGSSGNVGGYGWGTARRSGDPGFGDSGGASRFFYCAKASRSEREAGLSGLPSIGSTDDGYGSIQTPKLDRAAPRENWTPKPIRNNHPTVKPIELMRWLVRLVTPPGGTVLDPFTGSGTTGIAAVLEGFDFIGIERDAEYVKIAEARIAWGAKCPKGLPIDAALAAERKRSTISDAGQASIFDAGAVA